MTPILCIGELKEEFELNVCRETCTVQLAKCLADIPAEEVKKIVIAYEPVWAIGTGLTATPDQANDMHAVIKEEVASLLGSSHATPILYGGSVNADNADALFACPHVDGALVGGASLDAASFMAIAQSASKNLSH